MALSYNEMRRRAVLFAREYQDAKRENAETQTFYNDFFNVFGINRRRVASFEEPVKKLGEKRGRIDLFWKGLLLVEQKSAGLDLKSAYSQALDYFPHLKEAELPRYVLVSDFQHFELYDLEDGKEHKFKLSELSKNVELFGFIAGYRKREYKDQDPVNIKASELMGEVHDALKAAGYVGSELELLLVRLLFCMFSDDTGIFEKDQFRFFLEERTSEDGSDLGPKLVHLFQVLNTQKTKRSEKLDEALNAFEYINGDLFKESLSIADFDSAIRQKLLDACLFDWSQISPAVFGSLFQSVMDKNKRRGIGAHYTTEANILKVIRPLFMDELHAEFSRIRSNKGRLRQFHDKLASLTFLDPACGCGNFLIIAYRELRRLETVVLSALHGRDSGTQLELDVNELSKIDVDAFYGIEIEEFPARIAEVALWLTDHLMNNELSQTFGLYFARIPLRKSPHIHHANALRLDWADVISSSKLSYIMGNPPFIGKQLRTDDQQSDMDLIFGAENGAGVLDYVAAWYLKAAKFIQNTKIRCAFVSTNSITQGEQVAALWKQLLDRDKVKIHFAHRTFGWGSEARGMAHVHVVIIGFAANDVETKRLFDYDDIKGDAHEVVVKNINPYLVAYDDLIIAGRPKPLTDVPPIIYGSKPVDHGELLFTDDEMKAFLKAEPGSAIFFRPVVSADEFLYNIPRWCLWLQGADPAILRKLPRVMDRIENVRAFRLKSKKVPTQKAATRAGEFAEIRQPKSDFIVIPMHTSETRTYVPFGFFAPITIVHNSCTCIPGGGLYVFGVISSLMHMVWMRYTCGRLESRYRYSNTLVYNTFPWPDDPSKSQIDAIEIAAKAVLDIRAKHESSNLADLYDPLSMPTDLQKAHTSLDRAVDKAYRREAFDGERSRIEYLFGLYEKESSPLLPTTKITRSRRKSSA